MLPCSRAQAACAVASATALCAVRFDEAGWCAENTDGLGLVADIELHAGLPLKGCTVLLVGAGGAAAGVLGPLLAALPAKVVVVNRTAHKAVALATAHAAWAREHGSTVLGGGLHEAAELCGAAARFVKPHGVGGLRQLHACTAVRHQAGHLKLERHGHVTAARAGRSPVPQGLGKAIQG
ncbi:MAG: hypothetical protein ACKOER_04780 [Betaproteobacteria bacterium]